MAKDDVGRFATLVVPIVSALAFVAYNNPVTYRERVLPWFLGMAALGYVVLMVWDLALIRAKVKLRSQEMKPDVYMAASDALESTRPNSNRWMVLLFGVAVFAAVLLFFNKNLP